MRIIGLVISITLLGLALTVGNSLKETITGFIGLFGGGAAVMVLVATWNYRPRLNEQLRAWILAYPVQLIVDGVVAYFNFRHMYAQCLLYRAAHPDILFLGPCSEPGGTIRHILSLPGAYLAELFLSFSIIFIIWILFHRGTSRRETPSAG